MNILFLQQPPAKFGQGQRVLTFTGAGTLKTWFGGDGLENQIAQELRAAGYDLTSLRVQNFTSTGTAVVLGALGVLLPSWNYSFVVSVNAPQTEQPERVRQLFATWFNNWFDNVQLRLTGDTLQSIDPSTGQYVVNQTGNPNLPQQLSLWEQIFGKSNDVSSGIAKISMGTMFALGIAGLVIVPLLFNRGRR